MKLIVKRAKGFTRRYGIFKEDGTMAFDKTFGTFKAAQNASYIVEQVTAEVHRAMEKFLAQAKEPDGDDN